MKNDNCFQQLVVYRKNLTYINFKNTKILMKMGNKDKNQEYEAVSQPKFFLYGKNLFKGYLRYKTITSQNVSPEAQIKDFFIS